MNNKLQIKYDSIFIFVSSKKKKFKVKNPKKIKIIPGTKNKIKKLIAELNKNKITLFLEYGHLSFLLCFISLFFFIIFGLLNINPLLLFPISMFVLGMLLMPIWQIFINKWISKIENVIDEHRFELEDFYEIIDDTNNEDFSYKAIQFKLIPKNAIGFEDFDNTFFMDKKFIINNSSIMSKKFIINNSSMMSKKFIKEKESFVKYKKSFENKDNFSEEEEDDIEKLPYFGKKKKKIKIKIRGTRLEDNESGNNLKEKLIL